MAGEWGEDGPVLLSQQYPKYLVQVRVMSWCHLVLVRVKHFVRTLVQFSLLTPVHMSSPAPSSQSKFDEIRKSNQAAAQRLAESQYSSSSSDDDDDDEVLGKQSRILESTLTTYSSQTGQSRS